MRISVSEMSQHKVKCPWAVMEEVSSLQRLRKFLNKKMTVFSPSQSLDGCALNLNGVVLTNHMHSNGTVA